MSPGDSMSKRILAKCLLLLVTVNGTPHWTDLFRKVTGDGPIVHTPLGDLRGTTGKSRGGSPYLSFQGIRYAKPPVGDRRFRAPVPVEPWQGVRDATKSGARCLQAWTNRLIRVEKVNDHGPDIPHIAGNILTSSMLINKGVNALPNLATTQLPFYDEDCLFLNVYTPVVTLPASTLLPVLVFIHGGALLWSSGDASVYGPEYLMDKEMVLVTLNYRLGIMGFLYSNTSEAPGNAGFKDQTMALRWVQNNIRAFGGDPNKVTLYGESGGAGSVHYHILSPLSKGLFHAGVMSSSTATCAPYINGYKGIELLQRVSKYFNGPTGLGPSAMVRHLRNISPMVLAGFYLETLSDEDLRPVVMNLPAVVTVEPPDSGEAPFFVEDPIDILVAGRFSKIPVIMGTNFNEGTVGVILVSVTDFVRVEKDKIRLLPKPLYERLDKAGRQDVSQLIWDMYLKDEKASPETYPKFIELYGDQAIVHGVQLAAAWHSLHAPVYRYHFTVDAHSVITRGLGVSKNVRGPGHADDLFYVFYPWFGNKNIPDGDRWNLGSQRWTELLKNFVHYRNPTPNVSEVFPVIWPPQWQGSSEYLEFGDVLTIRQNLWPERMQMWTKLFRDIVGHRLYHFWT